MAPLYDTGPMTEPEHASLDARRRRLLYRATHRGTYENDILLGGFVQRHIAALCESDLTTLEEVLELPENDLADWLTGRSEIPPEMDAPMLRRIRDESLSRAAGEGGEGVHEQTPPPQPSPAARETER
jgi:antitoxin CptB